MAHRDGGGKYHFIDEDDGHDADADASSPTDAGPPVPQRRQSPLRQSVTSEARHQSVTSEARHQSVTSEARHQSVAASEHSRYPPSVSAESRRPSLASENRQPSAIPETRHQSVTSESRYLPSIPENVHQSTSPDNRYPSMLPESRHVPTRHSSQSPQQEEIYSPPLPPPPADEEDGYTTDILEPRQPSFASEDRYPPVFSDERLPSTTTSTPYRRPSTAASDNRYRHSVSGSRRPTLESGIGHPDAGRRASLDQESRRQSGSAQSRRGSLLSEFRYPSGSYEGRRPSQPPTGNTQAKLALFGGGIGARVPAAWKRKSSRDYAPLVQEEEEASRGELWKRPSVILPSLADLEKVFFDLVSGGDINSVREFLADNHGFNINCTNYQGMTALHLAIQDHNEDMVEALLDQANMNITDCVLHAIRDNQTRILRMLLDRLESAFPALEFVGCTQSSDFPADITPLILAAQCGHYEIIGLLMDRGHTIAKPHKPDCRCDTCKEGAEYYDGLSISMARINVFRAIVNPAYICHTSDDPILTAFELCVELQAWAKMEPEFRAAYTQMAKEVRTFAVELIGCCRTSQEVALVLNQRAGCHYPGELAFPRLVLAVDYIQKEFVAHPNTQQVLESAWRGECHGWRKMSALRKYLSVVPRMVMLPFIAFMCVFLPHHKLVKRWKQPCNKMLSSVASRLTFLILVFLESNIDRQHQLRGPPASGLEPVLVIYVIAYVWSSIRQCMIQGPGRFFHVLYNWYDVVTQTLFLFTFFFWFCALVDVQKYDLRDLERKYWNHLDPTLVAEGFFTVATIMAFGRLLLLCQLNYHLGPLQVSLGKMIKDIAKFAIIFFLILVAFSAGLTRFYQYYDGMVQTDTATGIKTVQAESFVSFEATLKTLFWALFCMSPIESADVIIENLPEGDTTVINHHTFTETIGYVAFALFEVMSVIVILNMLIATMSNTFQKVTDNVDIEWTYGRTEVITPTNLGDIVEERTKDSLRIRKDLREDRGVPGVHLSDDPPPALQPAAHLQGGAERHRLVHLYGEAQARQEGPVLVLSLLLFRSNVRVAKGSGATVYHPECESRAEVLQHQVKWVPWARLVSLCVCVSVSLCVCSPDWRGLPDSVTLTPSLYCPVGVL